jgi:hypothetical protein
VDDIEKLMDETAEAKEYQVGRGRLGLVTVECICRRDATRYQPSRQTTQPVSNDQQPTPNRPPNNPNRNLQDKVNNVIATQLDETDNEEAAAELAALELEVHGTEDEQATAAAAELPAAPTHVVVAPAAAAAVGEESAEEAVEGEARKLEEPMVIAA